jgi:hypothetical protein
MNELENKIKELEEELEFYKNSTSITYKNPVTSSFIYAVPQKCIDDFGKDLDRCSTQQNEGCGRCSLVKFWCWKISRFDSNGYIFDDLLCLEDELSDNLNKKEIELITKTIICMEIDDIIEFYFHRIEENIKIERVKNMTREEIDQLPEFNGW